MTVWEPGKQPLPAKPRRKMGRPPRLLQRTTDHQPVSVKQLATALPSTAFKEITWREGTDRKLQSRFAAVRVRAAHRDYEKAEPHAEDGDSGASRTPFRAEAEQDSGLIPNTVPG